MAEAVVSIAARGILPKVLSLASSEVVVAWGYEDKLAALHRTLELINAMLDDADKRKGTTKAVMVWLKQLKDVVDEADDVLDEIHYENLRREMAHKIDNINEKLFEINTKANSLGLQNQQPGTIQNSLFRETDPYLDEFKVVGRESDELHIIQLLTQSREEEKLTIVPIVGMGGMGKTTLAKSIYNNPAIRQHFDVKVWLCVSVKTEVVDKLLAKIYESLAGEQCKSHLRPNLIEDLQNKLGSKRYFLVLDDVWDEENAYWNVFKNCMSKVNLQSGSGILVTTRNVEIGTKVMTEDFHVLQSLPDDQCWTIFKERTFVAGRSPLPELEEIGRDIVEKCCGLPLLLHVIGGMLRNYNDKEKWLSIKDNKLWDMEEGVRVQNILKLSYDNLPNSIVKQCFVYCSIFKKDAILEREELIRLWMALGLVQADGRNKEAEDVGNDIVQILVSSSLFQDVRMDEYGNVTSCMHDLVHDLSLSLCENEISCLVDPSSDNIARIRQVKHLSVLPQDKRYIIPLKKIISVVFKDAMIAKTLRTLIFKGKDTKNISFHCFKNLRILKLSGSGIRKIDDSVGELVHLRYLGLSGTDIKGLPDSICKLYHLQTLNVLHCTCLEKLPEDMSNLTSLRHIMYGQYVMGSEVVSRYEQFGNLAPDFPIRNVGRLTSLITLPSFRVAREKGCQISELGRLKHLAGELCITNLEKINNKEDAAEADLSRKKNLYGIHLCWSRYTGRRGANRNEKDVLEGFQPHGNVKSLTIENFSRDSFPAWVAKMAIEDIEGKWTPLLKLVKIDLSGCNNCKGLDKEMVRRGGPQAATHVMLNEKFLKPGSTNIRRNHFTSIFN